MGSQKNLVAQARFHVKLVDGEPKVEWEPKVNRWTGAEIQAVLKGAATLDGEWQTVTEENKAGFRFFKVVVEVPYRRMKTLAIPLW